MFLWSVGQSSESGRWEKGNPYLFKWVCVCLKSICVYWFQHSTSMWLCAWLVRRTNFTVCSFSGFLQLRQGSVRELHSDINSDRAGRRASPGQKATYLHGVCVCVICQRVQLAWLWLGVREKYKIDIHFEDGASASALHESLCGRQLVKQEKTNKWNMLQWTYFDS